MRHQDLQQALQIFNLPLRATLREIKARHRLLVKRHHPDLGAGDTEQIRQVNAAYRLLLDYCANYRFCFTREEFFEQNPEERLREQFAPFGMGDRDG
ncbi:MAG: J domain-containing protein [Desulfuromonadales bacterium]|nr:J domain-containing protein [Desulfuromonadales bacterium]